MNYVCNKYVITNVNVNEYDNVCCMDIEYVIV